MEKAKLLTALLIVLTLFLTSLVSAELTVESNDLTIAVSYDDLVDDEDELDISQKVTIKNNGQTTENVAVSLESLSNGYALTVSPATLELSAQGSSDVTISGKIPVNVDQGIKTIGTLKVGNKNYDLKTDVKSMLELKKIEVHVDGSSEKNVNKDNEEVDNLEPGDEVELIFELRNLFDEDYDEGDIDGDITLELDDSDFGDDIDLEKSFDIKAGETIDSDDEDIVFKFTIPDDADEDTYTLKVTVKGDDGNRAEFETEWDIKLTVERDEDDLRIKSATFSPAELSCSKTSMLTVEVKNFGTNKQKNAALSIFNSDLGVDVNFPFEIQRGTSKDNVYTHQYLVKLKEGQKAGKYPFSVNALYDHNTFSDKKQVYLTVKDCKPVVKEEVKEEVEEKPVEKNKEVSKNKLSSSDIVKTVEKAYSENDYLTAAMVFIIVLILAVIVILSFALLKN